MRHLPCRPRSAGTNRMLCRSCWAALRYLAMVLLIECGMSMTAHCGELAEAQIQEVGNDVLAGLEHADEFIKGGQWSDAVETLARIMENQGEALIQVPVAASWKDHGFSLFVPLREYCQRELASWHGRAPEALATYRRRVDALADRWYQEALAAHSEVRLQRIVDELLLSSSGDQALLRLGAMALERGNYTLARRSWEGISLQLRVTPAAAQLLGCAAGRSWWSALRGRSLADLWPQLGPILKQPVTDVSWLAYPDSDISLAAVRARLTLVSLLEGSRQRAQLELDLLRRLHPDAEGELAGRRGKYADLVDQLVQEAQVWPAAAESPGWTTLAGCPARNRVVTETVDIARRPVWRTALPRLDDAEDLIGLARPRVGERAGGLLSYHVAVSDGVAYILQPGMIRAIELSTGQPAWPRLPTRRSAQDVDYGAIYQWSRVAE